VRIGADALMPAHAAQGVHADAFELMGRGET
jgi:hypothetical protein